MFKCDCSISVEYNIIVICSDSCDFFGGDVVYICLRDFVFGWIFVNVRGLDVIWYDIDLC